MRRWLHTIRYALALLLSTLLPAGCDVHEFPDIPERVEFRLRLHYDTDMTLWEHAYDGRQTTEQHIGETCDNRCESGRIRYVVRAYPQTARQVEKPEYTREFVFTRDAADGYDCEYTLELPGGAYDLMVWSDLAAQEGAAPFHDATDFGAITLTGEHTGCTGHRDAFRGTGSVTLTADMFERTPETFHITMQRPLAKFEFITDDVREFVERERTRIAALHGESTGTAEQKEADGTAEEAGTRTVNLEDYKVVFYYVGFMPCTYNMYTDKPVDSATGVRFETGLSRLSEEEAALGFDYVFVNGKESAVTVQIGIFDNTGLQLSLTKPIEVPLKRSRHTVVRGRFLTTETSGGVRIDAEFDGDYNLIIN